MLVACLDTVLSYIHVRAYSPRTPPFQTVKLHDHKAYIGIVNVINILRVSARDRDEVGMAESENEGEGRTESGAEVREKIPQTCDGQGMIVGYGDVVWNTQERGGTCGNICTGWGCKARLGRLT